MEKYIKERFNDTILQEALKHYNIDKQALKLLDGFESFIYEFEQAEISYILRINHSDRRSVNQVLGEVDWINYLAENGVSVSKALESKAGNLVETIDDEQGGHFLVTVFLKAEGKPARDLKWTPQLYTTYGRLLGKMHTLTQTYTPRYSQGERPQWDEDCLEIEPYFPDSEAVAKKRFHELLNVLGTLPQDPSSYGLVHTDAHAGNFFVTDEGKITLFDFDDSCYNWFVNDIAIVLFYKVLFRADPEAHTQTFLPQFLQGYSHENSLDPIWLKEIPKFLKLREITLYAVLFRSYDVETTDDWFCKTYMKDRRRRIEQEVPYIDFDFSSLAGYL